MRASKLTADVAAAIVYVLGIVLFFVLNQQIHFEPKGIVLPSIDAAFTKLPGGADVMVVPLETAFENGHALARINMQYHTAPTRDGAKAIVDATKVRAKDIGASVLKLTGFDYDPSFGRYMLTAKAIK
jgi:hypothetical protein